MQPTLTQVPRGPLLPRGDGRTKSHSPTAAPSFGLLAQLCRRSLRRCEDVKSIGLRWLGRRGVERRRGGRRGREGGEQERWRWRWQEETGRVSGGGVIVAWTCVDEERSFCWGCTVGSASHRYRRSCPPQGGGPAEAPPPAERPLSEW